ncbi:MAG: Unknown protein, partial [uncultured Thiotrichaceae bacterium]
SGLTVFRRKSKIMANRESGSVSDSVKRKKRPTLTEKVKKQTEIIEQLTAELRQKEQELILLNENSHMIDKLNAQLQKLKTTINSASQKEKTQSQAIDSLKQQLEEKNEAEGLNSSQQNELIEELSDKILEVEIKLASAYIQNKHISAQNTVKTHMMAGMSLALLPAPLFDIAALSGTQLSLLRSLSIQYDVDFDEQIGKTVVTSLVSGSLPVLTVIGLSSFAKIIPGIGTISGGISMTAIAGALIYATGQVFIRHFESGGTIQNFDARHWKNFFREQLEEGKTLVKRKAASVKTTTATTD